jgi:hypothetical protein
VGNPIRQLQVKNTGDLSRTRYYGVELEGVKDTRLPVRRTDERFA